MADHNRDRHHQLQVHLHTPGAGGGGLTRLGGNGGPSTSQVVAVATLLPVSGTLLALAGLTLVGTLIGMAVATPLFILFSPVLVPAAFGVVTAVTAMLAAGALGWTGMCSMTRAMECVRGELPEAKRKVADVAAYAGQKTEDVGRTIQQKAHESGAIQQKAHESGATKA